MGVGERLDAYAIIEGRRNAGSKENARIGFAGLREIVFRKWVWTSALAFVVSTIAFVAVLPDLFVRHKTVAPRKALVLEPLDVKPYTAGPAAGGGGGRGDAGKLPSTGPTLPAGRPQGKEAGEEKAMREVPDHSWLPSAPMIPRTVSLSIVVKDFEAGRASLDSILARHYGYAAGLNVATPQGDARTLQASLRIPAPQLAAAVAELKPLGRVEAETQNGEEVTQQHTELPARLKNSRETEQRLQDVLGTRTG